MPRNAILWLIGGAALCSFGCLAKQFTHDGVAIHECAVDIYTEQAMTNLIRARCDLPFVQLTYAKITVIDTGFGKGNMEVDQTMNTARDLVAKTITRTLTNAYILGSSVDDTRVMSFAAEPVLGQKDVYAQYVAFARDPNLFAVSDRRPECPVHIQRKHCGKFYWVPVEAGPAFQMLVLKTAMMRGPEPAPVIPAAYDVVIVKANFEKPPEGRSFVNGTLDLNRAVPNGNGTLIVDLKGGRRIKLDVMPFGQLKVKVGTTKLQVQGPVDLPKEVDNLVGQPARFYSDDYPPETWSESPKGEPEDAVKQVRAKFAVPH